jgi:hypothetical protein
MWVAPNVPPGCDECPDDGSDLWEDDDEYWGLQDSQPEDDL